MNIFFLCCHLYFERQIKLNLHVFFLSFVVHLKLEGKKGNMYGHELERNKPKIWGKKAHDWAYWWFMVRVWLWLRVDLWELHDHRRWHDPKAIKLRPWELIPNSIETHIGGMRKFRPVIWFWIIFFSWSNFWGWVRSKDHLTWYQS